MLCLAPQIQNPNCDSLTLGELASYYILWEHLTPQLLQNAVISSVVDEYHPRPMEGVDRDRPFPYTTSLTDPILLHESDDAIEVLPVAFARNGTRLLAVGVRKRRTTDKRLQ
jgi:hypothetical protein